VCKVELNQGEGGFAGRRDKVARRQRSGCGNAVWEFLMEIFSAIGTPSLSVGDQRLSQFTSNTSHQAWYLQRPYAATTIHTAARVRAM
jgi:hypothetical protein